MYFKKSGLLNPRISTKHSNDCCKALNYLMQIVPKRKKCLVLLTKWVVHFIPELSPHTSSSSTSTHFTDLMPDKSAGKLFNIELDDNSDSQECVDLIPDKPTGGLLNIELDDNSDSQECVDLMPDKPTGGLFNIELDDNSDSQECEDLMPDKPTGGLFNIELDDNSDSQECVDLMPDKPTGGLFNIELDDNNDSLEGLESNVAFPVSTFVNCANVDESADDKMDLQCAPVPLVGNDRLNRHLQNTSPTSFTDCTSPVVVSQEAFTAVLSQKTTAVLSQKASTAALSQEASTAVLSEKASTGVLSQKASTAVLSQEVSTARFTEDSDYCSQARKAVLHSSDPLETSSSTMSTRGSRSSSLHSECSSIVVHTTSSNNDDELQTSVAGNDGQDTWRTAVMHSGGGSGKLVACATENVDTNSQVAYRESNRDKHLSKSKICGQQVIAAERTRNTEEANIPGESVLQIDSPSNVGKSNNSVQEIPLVTSGEADLVTVTWSVPLNPVKIEPPRYGCTQCEYTCTRETLLKDHRAKVHGEKDLFKCSRCNYTGQLFKHLQKHMSRQHQVLLSTYKPNEEKQKEILTETVEEVPLKERPKPGKRTPSIHGPRPSQYKRQPIGAKVKILDENTKKKILRMISKYNLNLSIENKWKGTVKLVSILKPQCSAVNKSSDESKVSGTSKLFLCDQCDKKFKHKRSLEAHLNVHRGRFPFACADCDKSFSCTNLLRQHEKTHSTTRGHHCTEPGCRKSFRTASR